MAGWAKIKFFWKNMLGSEGSTLSASSTFSGFDVAYISNMMETNMWIAADAAGPHYITFDAGAGNSEEADYLAVSGHNLSTTGARISLQYSIDGEVYDDALAPFTPPSDRSFVREFTNPGAYRYWRLVIEDATAAPCIAIAAWGTGTELDYATASYDPHEEETKASVNLSQGGYLAGTHAHYIERSISLRFDDADPALYEKIAEWRSLNGLKNFFVMWEPSGHPEEVFLMRPEPRFSNPLKHGGKSRDISLNLTGRKE
ncbi:MAG: hypothetical protein H3C68_08140 [Deltaproteobacteria bacterium]|nr:hypothetical protein [Deltaproteobacteria bacterium]MBZ0219337.1 discoidin domain-containing protein [Deltaproteobacteria bacterium]